MFAVKPKKVDAGQRYFEGIVWVDDRDLQIVKSYGRGTGVFKKGATLTPSSRLTGNRSTASTGSPPTPSPTPPCTSKNNDQRIKQTVRYEDYKQFEPPEDHLRRRCRTA